MDSAGPIANRTAGKPTLSTGANTFGVRTDRKAEHFAFDWLGTVPHGRHRGDHYPPATGYRHS